MQVITFGSASASRSFSRRRVARRGSSSPPPCFQAFRLVPGARQEMVGGRTAYGALGTAKEVNSGSPVPDKNAIQGELVVLGGKNVILVFAETTAVAVRKSFLGSRGPSPSPRRRPWGQQDR